MAKTPAKQPTSTETATRPRLDREFRSWLANRMYSEGFKDIEERIDRFEVVAAFLSPTDSRCLDFQAIAADSGHADNLLRSMIRSVGGPMGLIEKTVDHEGAWFSLTVDPYSPPDGAASDEVKIESSMERLYRECCDEANASVRKTVMNLDTLRGKVQPAVGALIMDACVDLSRVSILLTRISATGVKGDREGHIKNLCEKVKEILREQI